MCDERCNHCRHRGAHSTSGELLGQTHERFWQLKPNLYIHHTQPRSSQFKKNSLKPSHPRADCRCGGKQEGDGYCAATAKEQSTAAVGALLLAPTAAGSTAAHKQRCRCLPACSTNAVQTEHCKFWSTKTVVDDPATRHTSMRQTAILSTHPNQPGIRQILQMYMQQSTQPTSTASSVECMFDSQTPLQR
ncbi:hypothetical protein COO60DRAFT_340382 [Scenedesmus sp. NREL 46B-D3]|nr:hypothetical protein COO60DRAFT_340382 [Scenedesmus sp. NREL 46B-D3]